MNFAALSHEYNTLQFYSTVAGMINISLKLDLPTVCGAYIFRKSSKIEIYV